LTELFKRIKRVAFSETRYKRRWTFSSYSESSVESRKF